MIGCYGFSEYVIFVRLVPFLSIVDGAISHFSVWLTIRKIKIRFKILIRLEETGFKEGKEDLKMWLFTHFRQNISV